MKCKSIVIAALILLLSTVANVHAGKFTFDASTYTSSGIEYSIGGDFGVSGTPGFTSTTASGAILTINGMYIRKNQKWKTLNITQVAGNYSYEVRTTSGQLVYSSGTIGVSSSVNLSSYFALQNSSSFELELTLTNTTTDITSITVTYADNSVICYPSPYVISSGTMKVAYDLPNDGKATVKIYDNGGRLVKTLQNESFQSAKLSRFDSAITWNGVSDTGRVVATGIYTVVVEVIFLSGSDSNYTTKFRVLVVR